MQHKINPHYAGFFMLLCLFLLIFKNDNNCFYILRKEIEYMDRNTIIKQGWIIPETEQLDLIIQDVQNLEIESVLTKYGVEPVRRSGSRVLALCPFHMDEHVGSFTIDPEKNMCWCFSCNNGGGVIKSMQKIWNKSFIETVLQIAADFNLIDANVYSKLLDTEYERQGRDVEVKKVQQRKRASEETLIMWTKIYEFIATWYGLLDEDKDELLNKRHLSEERLGNYFTLKTDDPRVVSRLIFDIKSKFPCYADSLADVPGFFEIKNKNRWQISMMESNSIGILLRNAKGYVCGVQTRDKDPEAKIRYKYLSFKPNSKNKWMRKGETVGTPIDVIIPQQHKNKIAIVEGRFKAEILAQQGFVTLSVQGVNNFKGIELDIKEIEAQINSFIKDVYIFYDADQLRNKAVFQAGIKLGNYIESNNKNPIFVLWNPKLGKGIDDLILNGCKYEAHAYSFTDYKAVFIESERYAKRLCDIEEKPVISITKEERLKFYDAFESKTKELFNV